MTAFLAISSGETSQLVGNHEMRGRWFQRINCTCTPSASPRRLLIMEDSDSSSVFVSEMRLSRTKSIGTLNIIPGVRLNLKVGKRHEVRKSVVATLPWQHGSLSDRLLVGSFCMYR